MTEYVEGYQPGILGRIAEMHGVYYAKVWGAEGILTFEGTVATEMYPFLQNFDPSKELLLTAQAEGRVVGSVAVQAEGERARLRWVILEEAYHGRGIGKELLRRALEFARRTGYGRMTLWTVEGLPASYALYERAGFRVVERVADARHGIAHVNLRMETDL
ncbi:MAG: GNAT family N-acetyltransferase [Fimbriimonas sp.]